jgi:BirA family biotin operon repressor/biotin-[acetyl-CoA-carboxylase] ligase
MPVLHSAETTLPHIVLTCLADGHFHSGTQLGRQAGCSRSAVWKAIQVLQSAGLEVFSVRGKGYRLAAPLELLDTDAICAVLAPVQRDILQELEVFFDINSTNAYLLERARQGAPGGCACLAEYQQAGRGRRGRHWVSPFGGNLYFSLLWRFGSGAAQLGGLSLAVAVVVVRVLRQLGLDRVDLKWPNDILVDGRKLVGILLEVAGEATGPCAVVVGIGLNVSVSVAAMSAVDQPWTDLETALGRSVSRNWLVGRLLGVLLSALCEFEQRGLASFLGEWQARDVFAGRRVVLQLPDGEVCGMARGVDQDGALLLARNGELHRYHSGEVSLRPVNEKAL